MHVAGVHGGHRVRSDGFGWPHRDGLKRPHLALVEEYDAWLFSEAPGVDPTNIAAEERCATA